MSHEGDTPAAGAPAAGAAKEAVYVYGVISGGPPSAALPPGVAGGRPVRCVEGDGGLTAVVGDVPADWRAATRVDAEAHDRVLGRLADDRTVVPMRFGVVMASDEEVRAALLGRYRARLEELLGQLEGCVQMTVKAYYAEDALLRQVLRTHPELKRRSDALAGQPVEQTQPERIDLGRDVAQAVEEQRELDRRLLAEPLAQAAKDLRIDPPGSERVALSAQALVRRDRQDQLDDAVRRLSADHADRFAIRYVGPVAPYSFADVALDAPEPAWG